MRAADRARSLQEQPCPARCKIFLAFLRIAVGISRSIGPGLLARSAWIHASRMLEPHARRPGSRTRPTRCHRASYLPLRDPARERSSPASSPAWRRAGPPGTLFVIGPLHAARRRARVSDGRELPLRPAARDALGLDYLTGQDGLVYPLLMLSGAALRTRRDCAFRSRLELGRRMLGRQASPRAGSRSRCSMPLKAVR